MERLRDRITKEFLMRLHRLFPEQASALPALDVRYPADDRFGEYSVTVAMQLAPILRKDPMEIAHALTREAFPGAFVARMDVVHPGFINISLNREWLAKFPKSAIREGSGVWERKERNPERIHLEYISANPTGPLTAANGRGGFTGDVLANVFKALGSRVHREYYFNDAGRQVDLLAESVIRRYLAKQGIPVSFSEELYQGEYITALADGLNIDRATLRDTKRLRERIKRGLVKKMMKRIEHSLENAGIHFDRYFAESELHKKNLLQRMLHRLEQLGMTYEKDGAVWVHTSRYGDDKDRVIVKSDGSTTYFYADIAYFWEKFKIRRFDRSILLLGADHHGFVPRLKAAKQALGLEQPLDVIIFQMVRIMSNGAEVRMSKRQGTFVTLEEVMEEVGPDATRFFFLMHTPERHMDFDLDLAKKQSKENPVYYLQYAYTRMHSILERLAALEKKGELAHKKEKTLSGNARRLVVRALRLPEVLDDVARSLEAHRLAIFALDFAETFHVFYDGERVLEEERVVHDRRLEIIRMSYTILGGMLDLLGISKRTKM